jgi:hypothetical protein
MKQTDYDYAAFRNGVCIAIGSVMEGNGSERWERDFYREHAGCEIKILPVSEACTALRSAIDQDRSMWVGKRNHVPTAPGDQYGLQGSLFVEGEKS